MYTKHNFISNTLTKRSFFGGRFLMPWKEAVIIWNILTHLFTFTAGTVVSVTLMWLLQAGKQEDQQIEEMQRRNDDWNYSQNAQPSPQVAISGGWGYVTNKRFRSFALLATSLEPLLSCADMGILIDDALILFGQPTIIYSEYFVGGLLCLADT